MESRNTESVSILRNLDWFTIVLYLFLIAGGVYSIYAASYDFDHASMFNPDEFSGKQIRWVGLSLALAVVLLVFDFRVYETYAYPIYLILLMIMFVTIFVAPDINGSRSWLVFGPLRFQPAEFGKFATALALSKLMSGYNFNLNDSLKNYGKVIGLIILPIMLILAQKETGSALAYTALFLVLYREGMSGLVLLATFCAVLFFVVAIKFNDTLLFGIPQGESIVFIMIMLLMILILIFYGRHYIAARNLILWFAGSALVTYILSIFSIDIPGNIYFLSVIGAGVIYCIYIWLTEKHNKVLTVAATAVASILFLYSVNYVFNSVLQPHQQQRINVALGIDDDLLGAGYNVNQAKIAIGSGGLTGKGHLNGTQTKLKYVPEQHTDFIYCTIGEEQGFVGTTGVLLLFLILILRVIHISERQPSTFGRVYGYCVASYFIFHLAINTGMVIGLCPVIGIPLPFFSYGGSSLWSFTILLFILLRIDASRRSHPSYF